jgi:hypothetical protein
MHLQGAHRRVLEYTVELDQTAVRLQYATEQEAYWRQQKLAEDNAIKQAIGNKAGVRGQDWSYSWKLTRSGGTDWKGVAESRNMTPQELEPFRRAGYRKKHFRYRGNVVE